MKTFITLFLLFPTLCFSQKLKRNDIDKITGDTVKITEAELIYSKASWNGTVGEQLRMAVIKDGSSFFISCSIQSGKAPNFIIPVGSGLFFKLQTGEIITLTNIKDQLSVRSDVSRGSIKVINYPIQKPDLNKLQHNTVTFIRIQTSDSPFEYDIKDKNSNKIESLCSLID